MEKNSYTRAEVLADRDKLPDRGLLCDLCRATIPLFEDLSDADEQRVRQSIHEGRRITAVGHLREVTGCSLRWAKLWVEHACHSIPPKETKTQCAEGAI